MTYRSKIKHEETKIKNQIWLVSAGTTKSIYTIKYGKMKWQIVQNITDEM